MNYELYYTSAPRGLTSASSGFCSVKMTRGIPRALRELLESLSTYRHVEVSQDAPAAADPVNFSFLAATAAGKRWHVLSRVQAAGLDHTNRRNFFAHHLAMEAESLPPSDPTWLLSQPGILHDFWDYRVEELASRDLPAGNGLLRPCLSWKAATGDAGWGGAVAQQLASGKTVYLVREPGMAVLPLVDEAMSLLPPGQRWQNTFSTYFCSLPRGVDCRLRCVLVGSPEAHAATLQNALVIDLARPLGPPEEGPLVESARSGKPPTREPTSQPAATRSSHKTRDLARRGAPVTPKEDYPVRDPPRISVPPPQSVPPYAAFGTAPVTPVAPNRIAETGIWLPMSMMSGVVLVALVILSIVFFFRFQALKTDQEKQQTIAEQQHEALTKSLGNASKITQEKIAALTKTLETETKTLGDGIKTLGNDIKTLGNDIKTLGNEIRSLGEWRTQQEDSIRQLEKNFDSLRQEQKDRREQAREAAARKEKPTAEPPGEPDKPQADEEKPTLEPAPKKGGQRKPPVRRESTRDG